jgi:hypothetical protein
MAAEVVLSNICARFNLNWAAPLLCWAVEKTVTKDELRLLPALPLWTIKIN